MCNGALARWPDRGLLALAPCSNRSGASHGRKCALWHLEPGIPAAEFIVDGFEEDICIEQVFENDRGPARSKPQDASFGYSGTDQELLLRIARRVAIENVSNASGDQIEFANGSRINIRESGSDLVIEPLKPVRLPQERSDSTG